MHSEFLWINYEKKERENNNIIILRDRVANDSSKERYTVNSPKIGQ